MGQEQTLPFKWVIPYIAGRVREEMLEEGRMEKWTLAAGQCMGLILDIPILIFHDFAPQRGDERQHNHSRIPGRQLRAFIIMTQ